MGERITVWRVCSRRYADVAFDGGGAALHPGRWNTPGVRVVYTSGSLSLAMLEWLAYALNTRPGEEYVYFEATLPAEGVLALRGEHLPPDWDAFPHPASTQGLGEEWAREGASLALEVPSVLSPVERNYLINPAHPDFGRVEVSPARPLRFDRRLAALVERARGGGPGGARA